VSVKDGKDMLDVHEKISVDLILLDLMLPHKNGFELLKIIRETSQIPIIIITAKNDDSDRIMGLELGADDYIQKPFNPRELEARIRAVLRRSANQTVSMNESLQLKFENWSVDKRKRELIDPDGTIIDLSTSEYELLIAFLEAPQRVLTREYLLDTAKSRVNQNFDRSIDVQLSRLRKKLGDDGQTKELIKTIRGVGYFFTAEVKSL
jgi:two-component system OmpR family response regulator